MRKWLRRLWLAAGVAFVAWLLWNAQAHGVDDTLLRSSDAIQVVDSDAVLRFMPRSAPAAAPGLIFLPGAAIDPIAYVPLLRAVAAAGYPVALVRLPWRAAPFASSRATVWGRVAAILASSGRHWVLAGHSRGAALSAQFVGEHPRALAGLVLIGTTHPKVTSLAAITIPVTKIYGTRDCVADAATVLANARLLPPQTRWVRLEGANHSQFGWYGAQLGDCSARITREVQQARTLDAMLTALARARAATEESR